MNTFSTATSAPSRASLLDYRSTISATEISCGGIELARIVLDTGLINTLRNITCEKIVTVIFN